MNSALPPVEETSAGTNAIVTSEAPPSLPEPNGPDRGVAGAGKEVSAPAAEELENYQKAFLLKQALEALPDHRLSKGEANRKIGAVARRQLQLDPATANRLREELAAQQYLRSTKKGQNITYELTDQGREYLQTLKQFPFPEGRTTRDRPINENVRRFLYPYLLLQIVKAEGQALRKGGANRFDLVGREALELTPGTANELRASMKREGLIEVSKHGQGESYTLTPAGVKYLVENDQHPAGIFALKGSTLNELLKAARESAGRAAEPHKPAFAPPPADLSQAAYEEFEELRREEYGQTGLVPIFRIRERLAAKYGPETARHDVLDEPIRELWRQKRVRMVPLADLQRATPEQLNASIPGVNETLFYLELARG